MIVGVVMILVAMWKSENLDDIYNILGLFGLFCVFVGWIIND